MTFVKSVGIYPLTGTVQHYEWGGFDFIPGLLGANNTQKRPFAELWIGAHPKASSLTKTGRKRLALSELINLNPALILGSCVMKSFRNRLPYLLKVLDARRMLSIQAHPNKVQAEAGFAREDAAGIPLDAPHRNYRDDNHKPEVHVALTDIWMLHGFRPLEELARIFQEVAEFTAIAPDFSARLSHAHDDFQARADLLKALYELIMIMPQARVDEILKVHLGRLHETGPFSKETPEYWALRAAREFPLPDGHIDRGIFSIYLLNLVHLKPGQGTYQPAGCLHAYLEGTNVELMANSDNVLRGGLTPKYVDVFELLNILQFEGGRPKILNGVQVSRTEKTYPTPAGEFQLSTIEVSSGKPHKNGPDHSADTMIVMEGKVMVRAAGDALVLDRGGTCMIPAAQDYQIEALTEHACLHKAAVQSHSDPGLCRPEQHGPDKVGDVSN